MSSEVKFSDNPLLMAEKALVRIRKTARLCVGVPIPLMMMTTAAFFFFKATWYLDPFLGLIYVLFIVGQVLAIIQMREVLVGVDKTQASLTVLRQSDDEIDLDKLRLTLLQNAPPGHLRDLLLRWIELGLRGETESSESLLHNAWDRRALLDHRQLSLHVSLNRTTLKLGFLGTLVGLIMTFPPMKRAIMSLAESEGEMKFIRDLVLAIDGDEYAILNTLIATGVSIMIELVTVQILERALGGFDLVNSHINDWNLTRLQPLIRKNHGLQAKQSNLLNGHAAMETQLVEAQATMDRNLSSLAESMSRTTKQIDGLSQLQLQISKRISELLDFERQYRSFMQAKGGAVAPTHLRREGEA